MRTRNGRLGPQAGFSLVEMMIAVAVMGLMLAIAMPRIRDTLIGRDVISARAAVANLYARARVNALQSRKITTIHFSGSQVWITAPLGVGTDTIGAVADLTNQFGVAIDASQPTIAVSPTGLANLGVPVVVRVTRSGKSDSVTISGYGRLQ